MDATNLIKLVEAVASLLQALGWPLIVIFIILYFGAPLKKFLSDISEFNLKAGATGFEASASRKQIESAAFLGAASEKAAAQNKDNAGTQEQRANEIVNVVSQSLKPHTVKTLSEANVLWVDDNPSNNIYERRALEALGIRFTLSTSTDDALDKIQFNKYDLVISDMGRAGDPQAGYTLLAALQKMNVNVPFIIYAGSNRPEHKAIAREKGAFGSTNDPKELYQLVLSALQSN